MNSKYSEIRPPVINQLQFEQFFDKLNSRRNLFILISIFVSSIFVIFGGFVLYDGLSGGDSPIFFSKKFSHDLSNIDLSKLGYNLTLEMEERFNSTKSWRYWDTNSDGDIFYTGKGLCKGAYKISGNLPGTPDEIMRISFFEAEKIPQWQPGSAISKILKKVNNNTMVLYQRTDSVGPVSARQFIPLNFWRQKSTDEFIVVANSLDWPEKIQFDDPDIVWGYVRLSGAWIRPDDENPGFSKIDQILEINMNLSFFPFKDLIFIEKLDAANQALRSQLLKQKNDIVNINKLDI